MKPCWKALGLTELGGVEADLQIDVVVSALRVVHLTLRHLPQDMQARLLSEAEFRVKILPLRTAAYRRKYEAANYNDEVSHGRGNRRKRASGSGGGRGR